jgi:hypothetical protein
MRVVFHPEAHAEMVEQARYYESKSEGLGAVFLERPLTLTNTPSFTDHPPATADGTDPYFPGKYIS